MFIRNLENTNECIQLRVTQHSRDATVNTLVYLLPIVVMLLVNIYFIISSKYINLFHNMCMYICY